jgi:hypothetical protein
VCTHDAGTVLRHRLVLGQQRFDYTLDCQRETRRRPVEVGTRAL